MTCRLPLFETHKSLGAKFVDFAGFDMPLQYTSIIEEHKAVRERVGLFDVSHMGEIEFSGKDVLSFLERVFINCASDLKAGEAQYTLSLYEHGGTVDDLILYCFAPGDKYFAIVNASNIQKDMAWFVSQRGSMDVSIKDCSDMLGLLSLQGPKAQDVLQTLCKNDLSKLKYFSFVETVVGTTPSVVSRTGYTGEDGFELCFEAVYAKTIWNTLLQAGKAFGIAPIGLGARDTLRLEMGYALYGHELSESINPLESGLGWVVKMDKDFVGKKSLQEAKKNARKILVGFVSEQGLIARHGARVFLEKETENFMNSLVEIGEVCSGSISPMLGKPIGTALILAQYKNEKFFAIVRDKVVPLMLTKPPFWKKTA